MKPARFPTIKILLILHIVSFVYIHRQVKQGKAATRDIRLRKNFRASSSNRTFAGHSLDGLPGAYALFKHPDMFDNYILGSPSVWYNDNEILQSATIKPSQKVKVYLSVGNLEKPSFGEIQDMVADAESLAKKINENKGENLTLKFQIIEGARHTTAFPTTLVQGLDWVYGRN